MKRKIISDVDSSGFALLFRFGCFGFISGKNTGNIDLYYSIINI